MRISRLIPTVLAAILMSTTAGLTTATAAAAEDPCGYFERTGAALYNHCTNDGSWIVIQVNATFPIPDSKRCVSPGTTTLGPTTRIQGAWYINLLCTP
ncbi:DUF6355 family natural product biosynthesis protein [Streptomyces sp. NPDC050433]|uniref:DUF6355 family natural product biosynthesis protein n=1 Tax=unclassified Streptomyces TaxID=2593676 RepID=UPI003428EC29